MPRPRLGPINAAKISEGEHTGTAATPSGLYGLEAIWLGLNVASDMFVAKTDLDIDQLEHDLGVAGRDAVTNGAGLLVRALGLGLAALLALAVYSGRRRR